MVSKLFTLLEVLSSLEDVACFRQIPRTKPSQSYQSPGQPLKSISYSCPHVPHGTAHVVRAVSDRPRSDSTDISHAAHTKIDQNTTTGTDVSL